MKLHPVLALIAAVLITGGCAMSGDTSGAVNPDPAHNARNSLDWAGAYRRAITELAPSRSAD